MQYGGNDASQASDWLSKIVVATVFFVLSVQSALSLCLLCNIKKESRRLCAVGIPRIVDVPSIHIVTRLITPFHCLISDPSGQKQS